MQRAAGIRLIHVPYKGAALAFPDLIAGRINAFFSSLETAMPQLKAGTIRVLAVTSRQRTSALPDVPTVAESGYKGFEAITWFGVLVPARTPEPFVARLSTEISRIVAMPDVRERMASGGGDVEVGPKAFAQLIRSDHAKWARIVKESGAKVADIELFITT